ncbi:hypothetical protein ACFLYD_05595 [Chloroflexota bacterium]
MEGDKVMAAQVVQVTAIGAADLIHLELTRAGEALDANDLDTILDAYVRALGLALQLGPAPSEQVLVAVLHTAHAVGLRQNADSLSALGPALVGLVAQVRTAGALPPTAVMEAWATLADDLGALIGQVGLALSIPHARRAGMMDNARARASLLDDATGGRFALTAWVDTVSPRTPGCDCPARQ